MYSLHKNSHNILKEAKNKKFPNMVFLPDYPTIVLSNFHKKAENLRKPTQNEVCWNFSLEI